MIRTIRILVTLTACTLQASLPTWADDASDTRSVSPLRRWAVIADPVLQKNGLSDLLSAELSSHGVPLVEREQVDRVLRELELSQCFGATGSGTRARLGKLLKADALVLLRQQNHEGAPFVRLIVSDCIVGARLHASHFDLAEEKVDELSTEVSEEVLSTRKRFARGVERLVTVTPLLSRNLTHEFDYLQNGYAAWLGQTLMQMPGVAVVELEEARAVRQELDLSGATIADAWRPLFVSGEFKMTRDPDVSGVRVALKLNVNDADREVATLQAGDMAIDEAPEWLASDAADEIARRLNLRNPLSSARLERKDHFRLLVERAGTFAKFGAYPQAISLQEAALLLQDDVAEELRLIENYAALRDARRREAEQIQLTGRGAALVWRQRFDHDLADYHALLAHARRLLGMDVSVNDLIRVFRVATWQALPSVRYLTAPEDTHREKIQGIREEFAWDAIARFAQISRSAHEQDTSQPVTTGRALDRNSPAAEHDAWLYTAAFYILGPRSIVPLRGSLTARNDQDTFAALERLIVDYSVPEWPSGRIVAVLLRQTDTRLLVRLMSGDLSEDQVHEFSQRLKQRPEAVAQFYGRCAELGVQLTAAAGPGGKVDATIQQESKQLMAWTESWQKQHPSAAWGAHTSRMLLKISLDRLNRQLSSPRDRLRLTQRPRKTDEAAEYFTIEQLNVKSDWRHLLHCRDDIDVVWSFAHVMLLRAGRPDVLFKGGDYRDQVRQVAWDGEFIWVGARQSGVYVFDLQGREIIHIPPRDDASESPQQLSLPAWEFDNMGDSMPGNYEYGLEDHFLRLFAVSPGRCLVMGRLGRLQRFWLALVERQSEKSEWSVKVLHEATRIPDNRQREPHEDDLLEACVPAWIAKLPRQDGEPVTRVVMGRRLPRPHPSPRTPLLIDLTSRQVTRFTGHAFQRGWSDAFQVPLEVNDRLILTRGGAYVALPTDAERPNSWAPPETVPFVPDVLRMSPHQVSKHPPLLFNGAVHFPGSIWRRILLDDNSVEDVNSVPLRSADLFEDYAVSGHFGLVGWNHRDHLYRIRMRPTDHQPGLADRYRFVPEEHRHRHHQAATRLREFGAVVTTRFGFCRFVTYHRSREPHWRTSVWIGEDWTGGDTGLRWLQDIYNLRELELVHAPVTDAAIPHIAKLQRLQRLTFERTEVTDKGLAPLQSYKGLAELRLVGADDGSTFSDQAMPVVESLSLERLMVYGPGFTAAMLDHLTGRRLRQLCIVRTSIDGKQIEQLKQSRPRLQVFTFLRY